MSILPNGMGLGIEVNLEVKQQTLKTYKIDGNRIKGKVDDIDAIKQAVHKLIHTERFAYLIYDWNYGIELNELIGKDMDFVIADMKRRFDEAIVTVQHVFEITDFVIERIDSESVAVSFTLNTTFGEIEMKEDIAIGS